MTSFTLDVAWRQILGLDLQEDEIDTFYDAVNDWIGGVLNPFVALLPQKLKKYTKGRKAYGYLVSKIERKLDDLERNGPDGSTLSCMFFGGDTKGFVLLICQSLNMVIPCLYLIYLVLTI